MKPAAELQAVEILPDPSRRLGFRLRRVRVFHINRAYGFAWVSFSPAPTPPTHRVDFALLCTRLDQLRTKLRAAVRSLSAPSGADTARAVNPPPIAVAGSSTDGAGPYAWQARADLA